MPMIKSIRTNEGHNRHHRFYMFELQSFYAKRLLMYDAVNFCVKLQILIVHFLPSLPIKPIF